MRKVEQLFTEYGESHQTAFNKKIHYICVPLIFFSIIGLLAAIPTVHLFEGLLPLSLVPYAHLGTVLVAVSVIYYLRLSLPLALGMFVFSIFSLWGNQYIATSGVAPLWLVSLLIFVVSWVFQFIGHQHEGKKPSFLKDLQFLLVGPAWILSFVYRKMGIKY